ncbi:MAG TPA: carboxypeptidase regulatory-like domain-containing protein [Candidatus Acidoferrales bacterium]|jgi:tetratricopeptide (TPR) repeat protein|nr:carboxypeptidase regulatory-like domain-containing protein [Candidatus Acidoferrales bacterium]
MKRLIRVLGALAFVMLLAASVKAQDGRVTGQVLDMNGNPWPGITVTLKSDTGRVFTVKTDKDGKYSQIGMPGGKYTITLTNAAVGLNFSEQRPIQPDDSNVIDFNFKQIMAQQQASPQAAAEQKQHQEEQNLFKEMQQHFNAGKAALDDSDALRKQMASMPADQKTATQDKVNTDNQTAITELEQAEKGVQPKDVKNHAVVLSTLGEAYDRAGRFDDAVSAYNKAIALNPQPSYYVDLSTAVVNAAAAQADTSGLTAKVAEAGADCDKAGTLDPTLTARCWKNIGIVLSNKNQLPAAVEPLQKATAADAKDAQGWWLLGNALTSEITSKQEGTKLTYTFPPGLTDAYQHCIDADPNGPYAAQAKATLDGLNQLTGGTSTIVNERKAKKK